jgi:prepilin-type N-terminal cleavage/methylation domain-containing protein
MKTFQVPLPLSGRTCLERRNHCAGFTLTELIIVMAIVTLLAALLVPLL